MYYHLDVDSEVIDLLLWLVVAYLFIIVIML